MISGQSQIAIPVMESLDKKAMKKFFKKILVYTENFFTLLFFGTYKTLFSVRSQLESWKTFFWIPVQKVKQSSPTLTFFIADFLSVISFFFSCLIGKRGQKFEIEGKKAEISGLMRKESEYIWQHVNSCNKFGENTVVSHFFLRLQILEAYNRKVKRGQSNSSYELNSFLWREQSKNRLFKVTETFNSQEMQTKRKEGEERRVISFLTKIETSFFIRFSLSLNRAKNSVFLSGRLTMSNYVNHCKKFHLYA